MQSKLWIINHNNASLEVSYTGLSPKDPRIPETAGLIWKEKITTLNGYMLDCARHLYLSSNICDYMYMYRRLFTQIVHIVSSFPTEDKTCLKHQNGHAITNVLLYVLLISRLSSATPILISYIHNKSRQTICLPRGHHLFCWL